MKPGAHNKLHLLNKQSPAMYARLDSILFQNATYNILMHVEIVIIADELCINCGGQDIYLLPGYYCISGNEKQFYSISFLIIALP